MQKDSESILYEKGGSFLKRLRGIDNIVYIDKLIIQKLFDIDETKNIIFDDIQIKKILDEYVLDKYLYRFIISNLGEKNGKVEYDCEISNNKYLYSKNIYKISPEKYIENFCCEKIDFQCCICGKDIVKEEELVEVSLDIINSNSQQYIYTHKGCLKDVFCINVYLD